MKEVTVEDMFNNWLEKFDTDSYDIIPGFSLEETKAIMLVAYKAGFDKSTEFDQHN